MYLSITTLVCMPSTFTLSSMSHQKPRQSTKDRHHQIGMNFIFIAVFGFSGSCHSAPIQGCRVIPSCHGFSQHPSPFCPE
uniref:Secreted protein n=1 Tax=Panagrellus redivivus TaxID=6233 RepID=A0A7E4ZWI1_PANRE